MIQTGDKGEFSKIVTEEDVHRFSEITGDQNSLHMDEQYAVNTMFHGRIVHGMLGAGIISAAIAMVLPGEGTVYLSQTLDFRSPMRIGDMITAHIKVKEIQQKKRFDLGILETICVNQKEEIVIQGEAAVILPERRRAE